MNIVVDSKYKTIYKSFLYKHKIDNVARYMDALSNDKITIFANINKKDMTSLIIVNLIENNYYIEDLIYDDNFIEVGNTLRYATDYLKKEQLGLSIIYDNYPYSLNTSSILLSCGYKCQSLEYHYTLNESTSLIKRNLELNLKNDQVNKYICEKYQSIFNRSYSNKDNTSTLVSLENNVVTGVLKFSLINESIKINDIFADNVDIYVDLINMMKNLTNKHLEINVSPIRRDLIEALNILKFEIINADFKITL